MKKVLILFAPFLVLVAVSLFGFFWWKKESTAPSEDSASKSFLITKGSAASLIGENLKRGGFIRNFLAFKIYIQLTDKAKRVPAGEYRLSRNLSLPTLVSELEKGPAEIWVTIPEGLRREEVAKKIIEAFELKDAEARNFEEEFLNLSKGSEGYLFPDTYLFPPTATSGAVFTKLRSTFDAKVDTKINNAIKEGLTLGDVVTLASILERETKTEEERPIVAGILLKRLSAGWPLQTDAALQYAVASSKCNREAGYSVQSAKCDWWPILTKDDLEINSKYNTYKFPGLPPGPIANPGLSSINAVVHPSESEYWFYLHDTDGKIHYAKTIQEHNANIRLYLGK